MINKEFSIPFYAKITIILVGIFALFIMLYIGQGIIVPLLFALIIAIALHPAVNFFARIGFNRLLAILVVMLLTFVILSGFVLLLFSQASRLSESWPILSDKFTTIVNHTTVWFSGYFNIRQYDIHQWVIQTRGKFLNNSGLAIEQTIVTVGSIVEMLVLVPVYVFLILFYKHHLLEFIRQLFSLNYKSNVNEVISQTKTLIQHYILGLLIEASIVATLYAAGLFAIGIDYALLLGFIAGLLNIIPYIGGIIILALIMVITIATQDSSTYLILVLLLSVVIHLIDNSFIIPKIVASKVKINALVSIISILAAAALLGISGMIICIPLIGIVKLIFDHIKPLQPWGFLMGDTSTPLLKIEPILKITPLRFKSKKGPKTES